jgi:hypothetical protein
MAGTHEVNFLAPGVSAADVEGFLGPVDREVDGPFVVMQPHWRMAHVMHAAGVFPSVAQARKNGWPDGVPLGYSEHTVGKRRLRVYVLNPSDNPQALR